MDDGQLRYWARAAADLELNLLGAVRRGFTQAGQDVELGGWMFEAAALLEALISWRTHPTPADLALGDALARWFADSGGDGP